ncbi:MAG: stage II sporulation protein P, partial [Clostridia bacterium]|nr:stage II sporulation protein P [Clostridia bacterium]
VLIINLAKIGGVRLDINQEIKPKQKSTSSFSVLKWFSVDEIIKSEFKILNFAVTDKTESVFSEEEDKITLPKGGMVVGLSGELPIKDIDAGQNRTAGSEEVLIKNETSYSIDAEELLSEKLGLNMSGEGPKVLIVHTHGTESYSKEGAEFYVEGTGDRNTDTSFNVVAVGDKMTEVFERAGIEVIHDRTMHDKKSYNGSYASSLEAIERYTKEYPSIQVVLDIHRDAIVYSDGTKAKTVTEIDGEKVAQLMFVVGTNEGGLTHDKWRENLKFAVKLQNAVNKKYPSLMRGINLRRERFNGHTTKGSLIIEVGTSGNTLSEAIRGGERCAEIVADFLNGI